MPRSKIAGFSMSDAILDRRRHENAQKHSTIALETARRELDEKNLVIVSPATGRNYRLEAFERLMRQDRTIACRKIAGGGIMFTRIRAVA